MQVSHGNNHKLVPTVTIHNAIRECVDKTSTGTFAQGSVGFWKLLNAFECIHNRVAETLA